MSTTRLAVATAVMLACGACRTSEASKEASGLDGVILRDTETFSVLHKVHDDLLKVCVVDLQAAATDAVPVSQPQALDASGELSLLPVPKDGKLVENTEAMIRIAYATWLAPLKKWTGKDVIKQIQFLHTSDGCKSALSETPAVNQPLGPEITDNKINAAIADVSVMISKDVTRSNVDPHRPGQTVVRLNRNALFYTTILHELGHTLGLGDAYDDSSQPISIMNKQAAPVGKFWAGQYTQTGVNPTTSGALYGDDVYTLKQAYCALYAKGLPDVCGTLPFKTFSDSNFHHLTPSGHPVFDLTSVGAKGAYVMRTYRGEKQKLWLLNEVTAGGPLSKAGLGVGDMLIGIGNMRIPWEPAEDPLAEILKRTYVQTVEIVYCRATGDECPQAALFESSMTLTPVGDGTPKASSPPATGVRADDVIELLADTKLMDGEFVRATMPKGTLLTVTNESSGWLGTRYLNQTGWVPQNQTKVIERY